MQLDNGISLILAAVVIDYNGVALVLGAIGVLLASIGTFIVQMVALARQRDNKEVIVQKLEAQDVKLKDLHDQGNSNLAVARQLSEEVGVMKGKIIGAAEERAAPLEPKKS